MTASMPHASNAPRRPSQPPDQPSNPASPSNTVGLTPAPAGGALGLTGGRSQTSPIIKRRPPLASFKS
eukprot:354186-Chlamydomonas_euryale.AAC.9